MTDYTGWLKKISCCTVSTAYFFEPPVCQIFTSDRRALRFNALAGGDSLRILP